MRVCLGLKPTHGVSAGGGVKFASNMEKYLKFQNVEVEYFLDYKNPPDILLMFDFRKYQDSQHHKFVDINDVRMLRAIGAETKVIHRVNDTGLHRAGMEDFVRNNAMLSNISDAVIYVSNFTKDHFNGDVYRNNHVILNGSDGDIFCNKNSHKIDGKTKLVTHHWSTNMLKGWDIYQKIDGLVGFVENIEFTVIGNIPTYIKLKNTKVIPVMSGDALANEIRKNDVYITASRYEACGMHYLEGLNCGLPLMYHKDGGGVHDVSEFGLEFEDIDTFVTQLQKMVYNYESYSKKIKDDFCLTSENQCAKYYEVMKGLL